MIILVSSGVWIGQNFEWWDLKNWKLDEGDNVAENIRNMYWTFGLVFGSLFALVGFANSLHRTQQKDRDLEHREQELESIRRKAGAEIFTQAVEQLGNEKIAVRLGGLYSLEQLARNAEARTPMDRDFIRNILETLASYVRNQSQTYEADDPVSTDVEAAVRILVRNFSFEKGLRPNYKSGGVDLRRARLRDLEIPEKSDLRGFDFSEAILNDSKIANSVLNGVYFHGTKIEDSFLSKSSLRWCNFATSNLNRSNISGCDLHCADFDFAELTGLNIGYKGAPIINWSEYTFSNSDWHAQAPPFTTGDTPDEQALIRIIELRTKKIEGEGEDSTL